MYRPLLNEKKNASNNEWLTTYDDLLGAIKTTATKIKCREFKNSKTNCIQMIDEKMMANSRSAISTTEGMIVVHNSFSANNQ